MKIILRNKINLSSLQQKMIASGWGENVLQNSVVESISYLSDGLKVNGYLAYPKDQSKKYPCIIWCRGGIGNAGTIDEFNARGIFGQIASWGYVVFASQYRGNAGSEGTDEFGGGDINDILNLIPLADEIECADKTTWGIEGWSRGGMMTYLTLTHTNIFKAAITIGGIANLKNLSENNVVIQKLIEYGLNKKIDNELRDKIELRSIINFPEKLSVSTPILLLHGTKDDRIPMIDSIEMSERLKGMNHPHRLVLIDGGDHFLKKDRLFVNELRKKWFNDYLH